jgi:hypothetical protein
MIGFHVKRNPLDGTGAAAGETQGRGSLGADQGRTLDNRKYVGNNLKGTKMGAVQCIGGNGGGQRRPVLLGKKRRRIRNQETLSGAGGHARPSTGHETAGPKGAAV